MLPRQDRTTNSIVPTCGYARMTDTATLTQNAKPALPRSANLDDVKRSGTYLTEAEEAVVEGILRLAIIVQRVAWLVDR